MRWSNRVVLCATLVLACSSFSTDALAFFRARAARACATAIIEKCGQVQPRVASLRACFDRHLDPLSRACASRLTQVSNVATECETDVKRLCGGVRRVADVEACMQPRLDRVSARCRCALDAVPACAQAFPVVPLTI
jgi:hypothetical protein